MDIHEVQSKSLENVELGLQLLKLLGCTFPKKQPAIALTTLSGLLRVKRRVKKLTTRDINELPILEDEAAIVTMTLLDKFVSAVWSGRPELNCRIFQHSHESSFWRRRSWRSGELSFE